VHRRPLAAIEQAELDGGGVGQEPHRAAEGVDLADDLPLGHAADRRVAGHLADRVGVDRQQGRPEAHPRRRQGRLQAGVTGADDEDVEPIRVVLRDGHGNSAGPSWPPRSPSAIASLPIHHTGSTPDA